MSLELDVRVEAYCDGCNKTMCDGDYAYCYNCAGADPDAPKNEALEMVSDWFFDNALILSPEQQKFGEIILESLRRERMPDIREIRALTA